MIKIDLEKYNILVDKDITESLKILFEDIKDIQEEKLLELEDGFYFLSKLEFNTKTIVKEENEAKISFASILSKINNLTIRGKEKTTIVIKDYISYFAFFDCKNIKLENLIFRTDSPNLHKLRVKEKHKKTIDYRLSNSSEFKAVDKNIYCLGINCKEPIISKNQSRKIFRFVNYMQTTLREEDDVFVKIDSLSETKKNTLRVVYKRKPNLAINDEIYIVDSNNVNCGFYIFNVDNIEFKNIIVNFSYSDLFKCINTNNITFREIKTITPKGIKISVLNNVFDLFACSGDIIIEKCDLTGICGHCLKMTNPVFKAKLIDENTIKIEKNSTQICNNIKENDEIIFANLKLTKFEKEQKTKVLKVFDNQDSVVLELEKNTDLFKRLALYNQSSQPKKLLFTLNKIDKVCKSMLLPIGEEIIIKNNELLDTDNDFISISKSLYSFKENANSFTSNKISIISNIFLHSSKRNINIDSDPKLPKKLPSYNKVVIRKNIYKIQKRKLLNIAGVDSLVLLENVFSKNKNNNNKRAK